MKTIDEPCKFVMHRFFDPNSDLPRFTNVPNTNCVIVTDVVYADKEPIEPLEYDFLTHKEMFAKCIDLDEIIIVACYDIAGFDTGEDIYGYKQYRPHNAYKTYKIVNDTVTHKGVRILTIQEF